MKISMPPRWFLGLLACVDAFCAGGWLAAGEHTVKAAFFIGMAVVLALSAAAPRPTNH